MGINPRGPAGDVPAFRTLKTKFRFAKRASTRPAMMAE
jgi:hypothetical protein